MEILTNTLGMHMHVQILFTNTVAATEASLTFKCIFPHCCALMRELEVALFH